MHNWTNLDVIYIYDGSFEGLMTIVFKCFEEKSIPKNVVIVNQFKSSFIDKYVEIETDFGKAHRVLNGILDKICDEALHTAYSVHLSRQ